MLRYWTSFLILCFPFCVHSSLFAQSSIFDLWENEEKDAHIKMFMKNGELFGEIVWIRDSLDTAGKPTLDTKNPNPKRANQPIKGLVILKGFTEEETGFWTGGTIYDPNDGKTYSSNITLKSENELDIRGYVGVSWIGRSTIWTRIKEEQ